MKNSNKLNNRKKTSSVDKCKCGQFSSTHAHTRNETRFQ